MLLPLPKVICCFRERPIAFGRDIMRIKDKQALRFVFRSESSESPQLYVMGVVTYGATCSPCRTACKNAEDISELCPEAVATIVKKHYANDYDSVEEVIRCAKEARS